MDKWEDTRKTAVTISLSGKTLRMIYDMVEIRKTSNRSALAEYLIRMGYLYVTRVLPAQADTTSIMLETFANVPRRGEHHSKKQPRDAKGRFTKPSIH